MIGERKTLNVFSAAQDAIDAAQKGTTAFVLGSFTGRIPFSEQKYANQWFFTVPMAGDVDLHKLESIYIPSGDGTWRVTKVNHTVGG